jgi:hypothetical protein
MTKENWEKYDATSNEAFKDPKLNNLLEKHDHNRDDINNIWSIIKKHLLHCAKTSIPHKKVKNAANINYKKVDKLIPTPLYVQLRRLRSMYTVCNQHVTSGNF